MQKKKYADGSSAIDTDQTRPMVCRVAQEIGKRVGNTIGPGGRNYMTPLGITNDGVSILNELRFEDEREDSIAAAFQEVADRQDKDAGDGTTTATLLTTALTPLVLEDVPDIEIPLPTQKTVMAIKEQLEQECEEAVSCLSTFVQPVASVEDLLAVAQTAMENHPASQLIAETIFEVGYNSNTLILEGFDEKVTATTVPGIHMPLKIETPSMYTNPTRKEASYDNPLVLVANHVFESATDLSNFFTTMIAAKKADKSAPQPVVIVGKQFSVSFTAQIVAMSRQFKLPILLLGANALKPEEFIDIAEFCDATYVDTHPKEGKSVKTLSYQDAGTVKNLLAGPKQTSMTGGRGIENGRVSVRTQELKKLAETEQDPEIREELLRRAAGLQGGVATIYVDAKTAVDRYYLKKKVEDAMNSCKGAMEHGTVPGGGVGLKQVAGTMGENSYLGRALSAIHDRVQKNAGGELEIDTQKVRDAYWTNKCAIENAVAVTKILVTMEGVIADIDQSFIDDLSKKLGYEN